MPYCVPDEVRRAWPKTSTSGLTSEELAARIMRGDAIIDAWLARRFNVPLSTSPDTAPPLVKQLSIDMAMIELFDRSATTPTFITNRFTQDQAILQALRTGDMALVDLTGALIAERTDVGVVRSTTEGYTPIFGAIPSINEQWDPDRKADERNARKLTWPLVGPSDLLP